MDTYVILQTSEDVETMRKDHRKIVEHFGSETLAERYLDGLINWNCEEIDDYGRPIRYEDFA